MLQFKTRYRIGTVNSINWARVVAQAVYYFKGYLAVVTRQSDSRCRSACPSGNFGNIFAGHIARQMGLPIRHLILATNENDVLDEFFRTGRYRVRSGRRGDADLQPVDGYFQGVQLRAFRLRSDRARCEGGERVVAQCPSEGGFDLAAHAPCTNAC